MPGTIPVRKVHGRDFLIIQAADQPHIPVLASGLQQFPKQRECGGIISGKILEVQCEIAAADHIQAGSVSLDQAKFPQCVLLRLQQ